MTCDVILTYSDLRAVHCRSKLGRASRDVGCIDRHFPIVWCAVDGTAMVVRPNTPPLCYFPLTPDEIETTQRAEKSLRSLLDDSCRG